MKAAARNLDVPLGPAALADVARIEEIWTGCRDERPSGGPWLFGRYSIADAMYAPVVLAFQHVRRATVGRARGYVETALQDPTCRSGSGARSTEMAAEGRPTEHP